MRRKKQRIIIVLPTFFWFVLHSSLFGLEQLANLVHAGNINFRSRMLCLVSTVMSSNEDSALNKKVFPNI